MPLPHYNLMWQQLLLFAGSTQFSAIRHRGRQQKEPQLCRGRNHSATSVEQVANEDDDTVGVSVGHSFCTTPGL